MKEHYPSSYRPVPGPKCELCHIRFDKDLTFPAPVFWEGHALDYWCYQDVKKLAKAMAKKGRKLLWGDIEWK